MTKNQVREIVGDAPKWLTVELIGGHEITAPWGYVPESGEIVSGLMGHVPIRLIFSPCQIHSIYPVKKALRRKRKTT